MWPIGVSYTHVAIAFVKNSYLSKSLDWSYVHVILTKPCVFVIFFTRVPNKRQTQPTIERRVCIDRPCGTTHSQWFITDRAKAMLWLWCFYLSLFTYSLLVFDTMFPSFVIACGSCWDRTDRNLGFSLEQFFLSHWNFMCFCSVGCGLYCIDTSSLAFHLR